MEFFTNAEAAEMAGHDAEFHRRDLFEAITRGEHPHMNHVGTGHALCRCAAAQVPTFTSCNAPVYAPDSGGRPGLTRPAG